MYENRVRNGMSTPPVTGESSLKYFIQRLSQAHQAPYDEHILLVHNVCLSQDDIDAAKKVMNNVWWAICPLSNIFIHNALPPIELMRKNGLAIALGTDSLSSNDDLDMVAEMICLHSNFFWNCSLITRVLADDAFVDLSLEEWLKEPFRVPVCCI